MALFSAIGAAIASAVSWIGSAGIGAMLARAAIGLAVSALSRALSKQPELQERRPRGVKTQIQQGADIPRAVLLGEVATAGSLVWHKAWGDSGDTPNAYYTRVTALSDLPIDGLSHVVINGKSREILWNEFDAPYGYPVAGLSTQRKIPQYEYEKQISGEKWITKRRIVGHTYEDVHQCWIRFYDGTQTAADPWLSGHGLGWGSNRVGRGVAYAIITCRYHETIWDNRLPEVLYVCRGLRMYDPSSETTGSSTNPIVQIRAILAGLTYGGEWVYGPQQDGQGRYIDAELIPQIDLCDLPVPGGAGMTPQRREEVFGQTTVPAQYRSGLEVVLNRPVIDTIEDLLSACNGRFSDAGDRYRIQVGDPASPVVSLTDADILSNAAQTFAPFFPLAERINAVQATYPSPSDTWETQSTPLIHVSEYEAEDDNRRLTATIELPAVPYREQAQRLCWSALREARRARRHALRLPARFAALEPGDVLSWTSDRNGYDGKSMRVDGVAHDRNGDVAVDLTEVDPSDYDWDAGADYEDVTSATSQLDPIPSVPGTGWGVSAHWISDGDDTARRPAILLYWDPAVTDVQRVDYVVRVAGTVSTVVTGSFGDVAGGEGVIAGGLLADTAYEVTARYIPWSDRQTDWTAWMAVTTYDLRLVEGDFDPSIWDRVQAIAAADSQALLDAFKDAEFADLSDDLEALADGVDADLLALETWRTAAELQLGDLEDADAATGSLVATLGRDLIEVDLEARSADRALEQLSAQMLWATLRLEATERTMTAAGIHIDPETGRGEIYGLHDLGDRVSEVRVDLDAMRSEITLTATHADIDRAIARAVLDPSQVPVFDDLEGRIGEAEIRLSGVEASVALTATAVDLSALGVRVTSAEQDVDALQASIVTKVETTTFTAAETRLTAAEQAISAIDGATISQLVLDQRATDRGLEDLAVADLAALLRDHAAAREARVDLAAVQADVSALVSEERVATASARERLGAKLDGAVARIDAERQVRASETEALAADVTALQVSLDTQGGTLSGTVSAVDGLTGRVAETEDGLTATASAQTALAASVARADEDAALADLWASLGAASLAREQRLEIAAARDELTARVVEGELAQAERLSGLAAVVGDTVSAVRQEQLARADGDTALAQSLSVVAAAAGENAAHIATEAQARVDADSAIAQDLASVSAAVGANAADIASEAQARVDADSAIAQDLASVSVAVGANTASIATEVQARTDAISAEALARQALTSRVGDTETSVTALSSSIDGVRGTYGVQINANGVISGFGLISDLVAGVPTSAFIIQADRFGVETGQGEGRSYPFQVIGNEVYLRKAFIEDASIAGAKIGVAQIDTLRIAGQAVTVPVYGYTAGGIVITANESEYWGDQIFQLGIQREGYPTRIRFSFEMVCSGEAGLGLKIFRGSTLLLNTYASTGEYGRHTHPCIEFVDMNTGSGWTVYTAFGRRTNDSSSVYNGRPTLRQRQIVLEQVKR